MRSLLTSVALMFFLNLAFAEEFSIEEKNLTALPKLVVMAIRAQKKISNFLNVTWWVK